MHLALHTYWMTQNLADVPLCGGREGCTLHNKVDLASGTRVNRLETLLQPFYYNKLLKIDHEE